MDYKPDIRQFLDHSGKITQLPKKRKTRLSIIEYLAEKFEVGCYYTESEVNDICNKWHTFADFFILRRELVDNCLLSREQDGSRYWKVKIVMNSTK